VEPVSAEEDDYWTRVPESHFEDVGEDVPVPDGAPDGGWDSIGGEIDPLTLLEDMGDSPDIVDPCADYVRPAG